jgi:magnesium-transporting ATPase (P-type)
MCLFQYSIVFSIHYQVNKKNEKGSSLVDFNIDSLFTLVWISCPIIIASFFDKDFSDKVSLEYPELYQLTQKKYNFNIFLFIKIFITSIMHSLMIFFISYFLTNNLNTTNGLMLSDTQINTIIYIITVIVVNIKIGMLNKEWNLIYIFFYVMTFIIFFLYICIYNSLGIVTNELENLDLGLDLSFLNANYFFFYNLLSEPSFYLVILVTVPMVLIWDFFYYFLKKNFFNCFNLNDRLRFNFHLSKIEKRNELIL